MDRERLKNLLVSVQNGKLTIDQAIRDLRHLPYEDLGFAKIDHHRAIRQGFPEVVLGEGKQATDIAVIVRAMRRHKTNILVTRVAPEKMARMKRLVPGLKYHDVARAITWSPQPIKIVGKGTVL